MTLFRQTLMDGPNVHDCSAVLAKTEPRWKLFAGAQALAIHVHYGLHVPEVSIASVLAVV